MRRCLIVISACIAADLGMYAAGFEGFHLWQPKLEHDRFVKTEPPTLAQNVDALRAEIDRLHDTNERLTAVMRRLAERDHTGR